MNITSSAVLHQIIAEHVGIERYAAEEEALAAVMYIVILDQCVRHTPVRVDGIVVRSVGLFHNVRYFIVLYSDIIGKIQLDSAGSNMLQHISLDQ